MKLPGISVVTPIYNAARTLENYFKYLSKQTYPKAQLEVILLDGGSTDGSKAIIDRYRNRLQIRYIKAGLKTNMEARRSIGFQQARHDLVLILDSDNYLYGSDDLVKLVQPMIHEKELVGSFSLHYHYDSKLPLFTRYVSLFGNHDPVAYYLQKADRQKFTEKSWPHHDQIVSVKAGWTIVEFNRHDFPTLGSNGSVVNKKYLKLKNVDPVNFFHTDILFDLLEKGLNKYAVVEAQVVHDSGSSIKRHLEKRYEYMRLHHLALGNVRRYKVFDASSTRDRMLLLKFIFYTITTVEPLYEAVEGFIKKPDFAWFVHPFLCWAFLITYSLAIIRQNKPQ